MSQQISQRGNVLFLILIVIALFAALSYTVANMIRGGSPEMISDDKASIYASEIMDYARNLRQAVLNMRINGCSDTDISFSNIYVSGYAHTPEASDTCKVFHPQGGDVTYIAPDSDWLANVSGSPALRGEWYFPANTCVTGIGSGGSGCDSDASDNEDLIVILPYIKSEICTKINKRLNLGSSALAATDNAWPAAGTKFTGSFSDAEAIDQDGVIAGCFEGDGGNTPAAGTYHFYQVLRGR